MRLPAVVSILHKAIKRNGGVTYIHCTAGLGRAPATAVAYMFWSLNYSLKEAHELIQSQRPCFPKLEAIKSATADILTGLKKHPVTLTWKGDDCKVVEISGLDIGWGPKIPLSYDEELGVWILHRELPEGKYEYKYIVDGEWTVNKNELLTTRNKDGHVNNYVEVSNDSSSIRNRLTGDDPHLSTEERLTIRQFLETYPEEN
ncbi:hypothetical protein ACS0TY_000665 [Phlomoides rotata]